MEIRQATHKDLDTVYRLICELKNQVLAIDNFVDVYTHNLQNPAIYYVVCEIDHKIIGFGSVHLQYLLHHAGYVAEIQELIVEQAYRNSGIGKAIITALEQWVKLQGVGEIEVTTNQHRLPAHKFYELVGYTNSHYKFTKKL